MPRHSDNHHLEILAGTVSGGAITTTGGGGGTQYTEDAAAAANPIGNMGIARRKDTLSASEVSTDGDNIALNATSKGELYVKQTDSVPVTGDVASGSADSGNPVKMAGRFNTTQPTLTDGQRGDLQLGTRASLRTELFVGSSTSAATFTGTSTDAQAASGTGSRLEVVSRQYIYNGASYDRQRTPAIFKTSTATASGDTAVWTPTASTKFRLMRCSIQITADAAQASGGVIDIVLRDATTALAPALSVFVPTVAGTTFGNTTTTGWIDLGNGILSATANNVLNVNLSAALTSGKVRVIAVGTEE